MTHLDANGHKHAANGQYTEKEQDAATKPFNPLLAGLEPDNRTRLQQILDEAEQNGHDVEALRDYLGETVPQNANVHRVATALRDVFEAENVSNVKEMAREIAESYVPEATRIQIDFEEYRDPHGNRMYTPKFGGFSNEDGLYLDSLDVYDLIEDNETGATFEELEMSISSMDHEDPAFEEDTSGPITRYFIPMN